MLKVQNFTKSYSGQKIIATDDLLIPDGIHWVRGVNGSGKSTFFRSVAGIVPYEGQISWNGIDQKAHPIDYRLKVNMSEAEPLYPQFLSGYDILSFITKAKQGTRAQLLDLAGRFDTPAYWKNPCGTYSSGMLKKVAIISAFLGNPELIILDEPLITIDVRSVGVVYELVKEFYEEKGVNFLLSSHQDFIFENLPILHSYQVENQTIFKV
ncbi:MAG: ABC transporter ATP-binding protein [Leadbetterella sp.]|nr:ABC transporter ATP-binding protein [Leadbetterella sp.]